MIWQSLIRGLWSDKLEDSDSLPGRLIIRMPSSNAMLHVTIATLNIVIHKYTSYVCTIILIVTYIMQLVCTVRYHSMAMAREGAFGQSDQTALTNYC